MSVRRAAEARARKRFPMPNRREEAVGRTTPIPHGTLRIPVTDKYAQQVSAHPPHHMVAAYFPDKTAKKKSLRKNSSYEFRY